MSTIIYRATQADLEIRGDGRTVAGIAVPFDEDAEVRDGGRTYLERFARGAFAKTISERGPGRVKFMINHDSLVRLPIGTATVLREDSAGLFGEFRVSETATGDEALTLIRDGVLDALSVGFTPISQRRDGEVVVRSEVKLREVSVTAFPAYTGAKILAVREDGTRPGLSQSAARARLKLLQIESDIT